jgi:hypothetical protein
MTAECTCGKADAAFGEGCALLGTIVMLGLLCALGLAGFIVWLEQAGQDDLPTDYSGGM